MKHAEGPCVGCNELTTDTIQCNCTQDSVCLRGVLRIGCPFALRDVPRAGTPTRVPLPGLSGRPGTRQGHGRPSSRCGACGHVGASLPCRLTARAWRAPPGALPSGRCTATLSASSRQRFQGRGPAAPARRRRPAVTPCTYGAPASSLARSAPRCEASGLVTTRQPQAGCRRKLLVRNGERSFSVSCCRQGGQVPGGARVQPYDFLRKIYSAPMIVAYRQRFGTGGFS